MAFEPGNQLHLLGRKAKRITEAMERACLADDGKRIREGVDKLLDAFADGQPWAVEQVWSRLEGKPAQAVTVSGDEDRPLITAIKMIVVQATNPNEINNLVAIQGGDETEKLVEITESRESEATPPTPLQVISPQGMGG